MTRGLLGILKLVIFISLIPANIAVVTGFNNELAAVGEGAEVLWWGVIAYTIIHLFIFTPQGLYRFWQSVFIEICSFAGVIANAIVLAVPVITTVLLLIYFLVAVIFKQTWGQESLIFFTGFTLALHIILSAQELYEEDESKLKGHYLFNISLIAITNILIVAGLLDLIFKRFSFMDFLNAALHTGQQIYTDILSSAGIRF
ncbi:MAG: hypothetical protein AB1650_04250 [Candidatus Omnitrophota bacterium]